LAVTSAFAASEALRLEERVHEIREEDDGQPETHGVFETHAASRHSLLHALT